MTLRITSISEALDEAAMGPVQWQIFIFAALGIFIDGYDFFIIAAALPLINMQWHPSAPVLGLIAASATVGAVAGGTFLGRYADVWGRRRLAILTMTLFATLSFASAIAWGVASLIVIRFLLGAAIGADYPTGASYVVEFMPLATRRRLLFASLSFQALGAVAGALLGLLFLRQHSFDAWRYILGFGMIPAVLILILRRSLPESPRWLCSKGRLDEAREVLARIFGQPVELDWVPDAPEPHVPVSALFRPEYLKKTIVACVPWFCMDVSLYGMALFTPIILATTAFASGSTDFWVSDIKALQGALFLDLFLVVGFAAGIYAIARLGILRAQTIGFAGMTIGLLLVMFANHIGSGSLIFAGFALFYLLVNAGPNGTTYMVPAEIYPTPVRATGSGLAASAGKVGASVGIFLIPVMRGTWGLNATLGVVVVVTLIGLFVTLLMRTSLNSTPHVDERAVPHAA